MHETAAPNSGAQAACASDLTHHELLDPAQYSGEKEAFIAAHGPAYGYGAAVAGASDCSSTRRVIDAVRQDELRRLHGQVYLDHAGSALYSERQLDDVFHELKTNLMSNPHRCAPDSYLPDSHPS